MEFTVQACKLFSFTPSNGVIYGFCFPLEAKDLGGTTSKPSLSKGAAIRKEKPGFKGQILLTSGKAGKSSQRYFLCLKMEMVPAEVYKVLKCPDPFLNHFERGHHAQRLRIFWDLIHLFRCDTCKGSWGPSGNPPACLSASSHPFCPEQQLSMALSLPLSLILSLPVFPTQQPAKSARSQ